MNADDELIYEMHERLYSKLALFSRRHNNEFVQKHLKKRGVVAYVDENHAVVIQKGNNKLPIVTIEEIPESIKKTSDYYIDAVLAASLALFLYGISEAEITTAIINTKLTQK